MMKKAFKNFKKINALDEFWKKQKEWLKDYDGCFYSIAEEGKHKMKWATEKEYYEDKNFKSDINCISRKKDRTLIEFDGDEKKAKEDLDKTEKKLKELGFGFIRSTHKGKSDYLHVEFTRDLTSSEVEQFLSWIAPEGSEVDLNFKSDNKVFAVLFAVHWKHSFEREIPIEYFEGEQIDYDSLKIPKQKIKKKIITGEDGFNYVTGVKGEKIDREDFLIKEIKYNRKGEICLDDDGEIIFSSIKVNVEKVADFLISKYNFKTIYGEKSEKIKVFDGKIFVKGARGIIKNVCERILKTYAKKNVVEEIFDKIKRKTKITPEEFDKTDLYLIPLENGCYNIKTKNLINHSPEHNFTFLSPVEYDVNAKCPNWFKFIEEALYPEDVKVMKQWFGFNLFRQYFIKRAMILLGKKDTGKTILLDTLIAFVGEENKCGLSIQKITSGSDFSKFALKGKLSNVYDDLSSADINDGGSFKIATGGGYISAEEKFGDCVQFKTFAKQTLAGNKAPPVKDNDDDAYFGRFMPIICENIPEKKDPFLRDKITTSEELGGVLNWALEGLHEILKKGDFDFNKNDDDIKQIMELSGDPLIQFGAECLEQCDGKISKEEMYETYCKWANEMKKPVLSKEQLGRRLNQKITYLVPKISDGKRIWDNVKISEKWKDKNDLQGKQNTLNTSPNIMRNYYETTNNGNNNGSKNNIYKVGESVESVINSDKKQNTLNTISKKEKETDEEKIDGLLGDEE